MFALGLPHGTLMRYACGIALFLASAEVDFLGPVASSADGPTREQ